MLFGFKPFLKAKQFNPVEQGIEINKVKTIEMIGIRIKCTVGSINNLKNAKFRIMENIPMKIAVNIDRV